MPYDFMPCPGARIRPTGIQRDQCSVQVRMAPCDMRSVGRTTLTASEGALAPPLLSSHVNVSEELLRKSGF